MRLEHWGCPWSRDAGRPCRGAPVRRDEEAAHLVRRRQDRLPHAPHAVPDLAEVLERLRRYDEWYVTKLLVDDGRVQGVVAIEMLDRPDRDDLQARSVILAHRRRRARLPLHHQRRHQDRRRHGAGLPRRRAAQGHGVRPVPPDRAAVHRHPDHRGRPRRGRLAAQQGRLPLPAGLRPRQAVDPRPCMRSMELGPRDRLSQAFVHEVEKGRTIETPVRPGGPPRPAPPRREEDRREAAVRARAVPRTTRHRPGRTSWSRSGRSSTT